MIGKMGNSFDLGAYDVIDTSAERGYDDLVALACEICGTSGAVIGFVDGHRYWFKAKSGIDVSQLGADDAITRFVLEQDSYVAFPDLSRDPRTASAQLVAGPPALRFYAGTPLRTPFGTIGALCVVDPVPRPEALSETQRSSLQKLACQVVDLLELRRQTAALQKVEARWKHLFQSMEEGVFLAVVLRDAEGRVCDWRYEEVNPAWERHMCIPSRMAVGRSVRELFGAEAQEWIDLAARVIEERRRLPFTKRIGSTKRWYDGAFQCLGAEHFYATFHEVSERVAAEARQEGLIRLGDLLREARDIQPMIDTAMVIIGEALEADRVTYGALDHDVETLTVMEGWKRPDMPPIAGLYRFDEYGRLRETLLKGEDLVIEDVLTDIRTVNEADAWLALRARGVINIPVRESGRTIALLLVHFAQPHCWSAAERHWLRNAADRIEVAIARRRGEEMQAVINGEIAHRLRNTLAMVQAIARMTLRNVLSREEADRFSERLQSLGRAHDLLHGDDQRAAILGELAAGILRDASVSDRCRLSGPVVRLGSRASMSAALLLHEMTTNAIKHGALSCPEGRVELCWHVERSREGHDLVMRWQERDGPRAHPPERTGFGSRLISFGLAGTGGTVLRYDADGLSAEFRADIEKIKGT